MLEFISNTVKSLLHTHDGKNLSYSNRTDGKANLDVAVQDQTTQPVGLFSLQGKGAPTTLTANSTINANVVNVASVANISVGDYLGIFSGASEEGRFYFGEVISISSLELTLDTPLDFAFESGDNVISTTRDLNVNGSVTPQTFEVRGPATIGKSIDITRIIIKMICTNKPEFDMFGDITGGLANGIVLRRNNGIVTNIFTAKTNGDLANVMYDISFLEQAKTQGVNGITGRMTFAGQSKHGVTIRLAAGESLDIIIQDDLSSLESFRIIAQGHVVD